MTAKEKVLSMDKTDVTNLLIERLCPSNFGMEDHCVHVNGVYDCKFCWNHEIPDEPQKQPTPTQPQILDSGNRREFETGAVRDIQEGKGRCDLLPLDIIANYISLTDKDDAVLLAIAQYIYNGESVYLKLALDKFRETAKWDVFTMLFEVSKHYEEGAKKYGERNWEKGIPVRCYIDSAVRHYLKYLRGDQDEPHDRAFVWNIVCAIWTCKHKPELNEYAREGE